MHGIRPREIVGDGGFQPAPTRAALPPGTRMFLSGRHESGSRRTSKRQARYRTGCEGRISDLKRRYGLRRSRLKGHDGQQTWTGCWTGITDISEIRYHPTVTGDAGNERAKAHQTARETARTF